MKDGIVDKPNPRAYIGIFCTHVFFYYALKGVYQHLENAEFILDFTASPNGFEYPEWYKNRIRRFLSRAGVFWRDFESSPLQPGEFFSKYTTLVAPFYGGLIAHPCNKDKKKARVFYGTAKDSWAFALWNVYFDLVLCPSDYYTERMNRLYGPIAKTTGEPKLDTLLEPLPEDFLAGHGITLDPLKPTLIYAPTWGALSSEDVLIPQLLQLLPDYNIVYKPHHMTFMSRYEFIADLNRASDIQVAAEDVSFMDLLKIDAVVVSDNSGAIFDTLHSGKPFILIDTLAESPVNVYTETPFFTFSGGKFTGVATSAESLEQVIKQEGVEIAPVVRTNRKSVWHQGSLRLSIIEAIRAASDEVYSRRQDALRAGQFKKIDGEAGKRAALAIKELSTQEGGASNEMRIHLDEFKQRVLNEAESKLALKRRTMPGAAHIAQIRQMPYLERIKAVSDLFF